MKKALTAFLLSLFLLFSVFAISSCSSEQSNELVPPKGGNDPEPEVGTTDFVNLFSDNYKIIYKDGDTKATRVINNFINKVAERTGIFILKDIHTSAESIYEIQVGNFSTRDEINMLYSEISDYSGERISAYSIRFYGTKLVVAATDHHATELALNRLVGYALDGELKVPTDINDTLFFDSSLYSADGTVKAYTSEELDVLCLATDITVNGKTVDGFDSTLSTYSFKANYMDGYPTVSCKVPIKGNRVEIVQPSSESGGIASIKITSKDAMHIMTYNLVFNMQEVYETKAEVVNKENKKGVITLVIDDSNISTARIIEELLAKYPELTLTFAMITKNFAGFELTEDETEYKLDENGSFIITQTDKQRAETEYWKSFLEKFPYVEIISHSHTHSYAGEDDTKFHTDYDNQGNPYIFPKGAISAEVFGSKQIIKELFGFDSKGFIIPEISGTKLGLSIYSWWEYIKSGVYLGARGTDSSVNEDSMTMGLDDMRSEDTRWSGRAFMVEYFNMATYVDSDGKESFYHDTISAQEAISNGIGHAEAFIDSALNNGEWACFCIHDIIDAEGSGTHPIYREQADMLFDYINTLGESGDAWVATYADALTYYCEWSTAKTTAVLHKDEYIELLLSCEEKNELFTMPLTVKVQVPAAWTRACYTYMGVTKDLDVHIDEDGIAYVLVDAVPESAPLIISPVL